MIVIIYLKAFGQAQKALDSSEENEKRRGVFRTL